MTTTTHILPEAKATDNTTHVNSLTIPAEFLQPGAQYFALECGPGHNCPGLHTGDMLIVQREAYSHDDPEGCWIVQLDDDTFDEGHIVPIPGNERTVFLSTQYQRPPIDVERVTVRGRVAGVWFASRS